LGFLPFLWDFYVFSAPLYTSPSSFRGRRGKKKRERCKGEPLLKLVGFWWDFDHFHGNLRGILAI